MGPNHELLVATPDSRNKAKKMYSHTLDTEYSDGGVLKAILDGKFGPKGYKTYMRNNRFTVKVPTPLTAAEIDYIKTEMWRHFHPGQ